MLTINSFADCNGQREHIRTRCELMVHMKSRSSAVHHVDSPTRSDANSDDVVEVDPTISDDVLALLGTATRLALDFLELAKCLACLP